MTDDERRRLIHIDSDIWIPGFFDMERVSSRVRHDPPPPLTREIRTGSIRRGAKTRRGDEWNRTIFAYRPARWFATRQTIVREAFLLSGGARMEEGGGK